MNLNEFIQDKLKEIGRLFEEKQSQYKKQEDDLSNFRMASMLEYGKADYTEMYEEAKHFMLKHIAHIYGGDVNSVKAKESLSDIAVYSLIMAYMIECNEWKTQYDKKVTKVMNCNMCKNYGITKVDENNMYFGCKVAQDDKFNDDDSCKYFESTEERTVYRRNQQGELSN